jgi:hypothetical protein
LLVVRTISEVSLYARLHFFDPEGLLRIVGDHRFALAAVLAVWRGRDAKAGGALKLFERRDHTVQLFLLNV